MNTRLVANSILVVLLLALLVGSALVELLAEFLWLEEVGYSTVLWTPTSASTSSSCLS
ncbi:MAG: hypothetical protein HY815_14850 [Candidatus Riflebacteria bacterium]|nr:hypothetical protein [Candidatus Riflebacteria bacterium]